MKKLLFLFFLIFLICPIFVLAESCVDINTASLGQLQGITQVGPSRAQAIIDARPFSSVDDLSRVKGIGNGTRLQQIKDQGLASVNCASTTTSQPEQTNPPIQTTQTPQEITQTPTPSPTLIVYPDGIYINELLPNPKGADETDEWIELYNSNNFSVDLSGWQIQDTTGTVTTYTIPQNTKILADGFLVSKRPDTNIMLNNDQDGLSLLTPDGKTADSINFTSAPLGQSYSKTSSGWKWSTTLTPGAVNIIPASASTTSAAVLPKSKNSDKNDVVAAGLADVSQSSSANQENTISNPWFLFFTVLAITITLAATTLFIKLKFLKNNVRT